MEAQSPRRGSGASAERVCQVIRLCAFSLWSGSALFRFSKGLGPIGLEYTAPLSACRDTRPFSSSLAALCQAPSWTLCLCPQGQNLDLPLSPALCSIPDASHTHMLTTPRSIPLTQPWTATCYWAYPCSCPQAPQVNSSQMKTIIFFFLPAHPVTQAAPLGFLPQGGVSMSTHYQRLNLSLSPASN